MNKEEAIKRIYYISNNCEEICNNLSKEEQTRYKMLPDIQYLNNRS